MTDMESLDAILESHARWLAGDASGTRADLRGADLRGADLRDANLHRVDLRWADLHFADLRGADLRGADLREANLREADLHFADLCGANLRDANLRDANLYRVDLHDADLCGANLRDANLHFANLREANLRRADLRETVLRNASLFGADLGGNLEIAVSATSILPEGDLIGWKKALARDGGESRIVKLLIPSDAERTNATGRKCRASRAVVLEVQDMDGRALDSAAVSFHDPGFEYRAGETVAPAEPFFADRWEECASGLHFFITRREAVEW